MTSPAIRSTRNIDLALFALRIAVGVAFTFHGYQKCFQIGFTGLTGFFSSAGVPLPGFTAPAVGIVEFAGGILLLLGLLFRVVPWLFVIDMLGAIVFVHGKNGYSLEHQGYEFVFTLMLISFALGLAGPGAYSLDSVLRSRRS